MSESLVPPRFVFHFSLPCRRRDPLWTDKGLEPKHRLASFAELDAAATPAEFRAAWSEAGLAFTVLVGGKRQPPWCRVNQPDDSDGVQIWIDTRDVHNVHRAGRFCHRFLFMPTGAGNRLDQPVAQWLPINRAREQPRAIAPGQLQLRSQRRPDGYTLDILVPAAALTDRELGPQTLSAGSPLPFEEDPSLWPTLELVM